MTYLSRLILDPRSAAVRRALADCHQLHRLLLGAFAQAPDGTSAREHFGLLYRSEPAGHDARLIRVLVQSSERPDWSGLPRGYLGPSPDARGNPSTRDVGADYERIQAGTRLIFRLRANPTRRVGANNTEQGERWRGKRIELRREEEQLTWLARKGEQHGFRLVGVAARPETPDVRTTTQEKLRGQRPAHASTSVMPLRFGAVLFEGRLDVTDRELFLGALRGGIGSGKAFGFGLLSIASAE